METEAVEDVNKSAFRYFFKRFGLILVLPSVLITILSFYFSQPILAGFPFIAILIGAAIAYSKMRKEFMMQFAKANKFTYIGYGDPNDMKGTLFSYGSDHSIGDLVKGWLGEQQVLFFFYSYVTGSGKHRETHNYTVCEITLDGKSPNIVLNSRDDWDLGTYTKSIHKQVPIESAAQDHFSIFAPEGLEIETFEIFTPDVLSVLIDIASGYNFEFIDNRLYVFQIGIISKKKDLERFLKLIDYLSTKVAPKILRL